jgi:hypothetical protein
MPSDANKVLEGLREFSLNPQLTRQQVKVLEEAIFLINRMRTDIDTASYARDALLTKIEILRAGEGGLPGTQEGTQAGVKPAGSTNKKPRKKPIQSTTDSPPTN